jgi:putative ABC transport system permease protein
MVTAASNRVTAAKVGGSTALTPKRSNYLDWQARTTAFEQLAAIDSALSNLTGLGEPEEIRGQYVTSNYFSLLELEPALGRSFTDSEANSEAQVIILSHRFWERRMGSDPAVLGRTVELDRKRLTVIGVMPPDFERLDVDAEFWRPFHLDPNRDYRARDGRYLAVIARLKPGVSVEAAQVQLTAVAARLEQEYPKFSKGWGVRAVSMRAELSGDYRPALYTLLGEVGLVLLIACANIANLLLSRGIARGREFGSRSGHRPDESRGSLSPRAR